MFSYRTPLFSAFFHSFTCFGRVSGLTLSLNSFGLK
jgi:hypothetical protein